MNNQSLPVLPSTLLEDSINFGYAHFMSCHQKEVLSVILDDDGINPLLYQPEDQIKRESLTETYLINYEHRTVLKNGKGQWIIPETLEMMVFSQMRYFGAFKNWQKKGNGYISHKGWGLYLPNISGSISPEVLGKSYNGSKEVKVCEFREGDEHHWHGFPIDYTDHNTDYIHDNTLVAWLRMGIIEKKHITRIQQKRKVKSLCI